MSHAEDYANTIAQEVLDVQELFRHDRADEDADNEMIDLLLDRIGIDREALAITFDGSIGDAYLSDMLDTTFYRSVGRSDPQWIVRLLRTTGGPHCEIDFDSSLTNMAIVNVWWGSWQSSKAVHCPDLYSYVENLVAAYV